MPTFTAVDLGATSGRVVNVDVEPGRIALDAVHRFPNAPVAGAAGARTWDLEWLLHEVLTGLAAAAGRAELRSVGVDAWGVDYGLLTADGTLLGPVHAYRSARTDGVMEAATARVGRERLYTATGTQFLPFNTVYQLLAARDSPEYAAAASLLMIPDLVNHALCGSTSNDVTNASTTQLLDVRRRTWDADLVAELGLRAELLPPLHEPGALLGVVRSGATGAACGVDLRAVASHDTASAVAGTPLDDARPGIYVSCGTWALVGCELPEPVTTAEARRANVTNELGVDGTTRLLRNVTGLWLLEECRRAWSAAGDTRTVAELVAAAAAEPAGRAVVDPDDPTFAAGADMPAAVAAALRATGQRAPDRPEEITRVLLDSLALSIARTVAMIERISGRRAEVIHLVGGGARNATLARACASACDRPVLVGPAEATVIGNALVQAVAAGVLPDVAAGRRLVAASLEPQLVEPAPIADWQGLAGRLSG